VSRPAGDRRTAVAIAAPTHPPTADPQLAARPLTPEPFSRRFVAHSGTGRRENAAKCGHRCEQPVDIHTFLGMSEETCE
jgi:hypothetical protein